MKFCLHLYVVSAFTLAVELDLQGSLTVGSEVAEFLAYHLKSNAEAEPSGRRSMTDSLATLQNVIKLMKPCKDVATKVCTPNLEKLIIDYSSDLTAAIKKILDAILEDELSKVKYFEKCLKEVKHVVAQAHDDADEVYRWTNVLKKISGVFLKQAIHLTQKGLANAEKEAQGISALHVLKQELTLRITDIEKEYLVHLCKNLNLCPYKYACTIYLQLLLNTIKSMEDNKVKLFLHQFKNNFLHASVFTEDEEVKRNFEGVLREMLLNNDMAVKDIIMSISDVVQRRLSVAEIIGTDAVLLQMILSDMDHLYASTNIELVEDFFNVVKTWIKSSNDKALGEGMMSFYDGMENHLSDQPKDIVSKLKTEVQVFLMITTANNPALSEA